MSSEGSPTTARPMFASPWWVLAIPAAFTLWRLVYLWFSPLELSEDEAMYWDWSRHLALGYYTKPGGIAWVIRLGTEVFGHTEFGVRVGGVVAGFFTALFAGLLARDMFKDHATAAWATLCAIAVPAFAVLGVLNTIDAPYLACWSVAAWAGHRALVARDPRAWAWLALAIGLGLQFKPTILLLLPGLALGAWWNGRDRSPGPGEPSPGRERAPWKALAGVILLASLVPTLVYNATHGWVQASHLLEHLGFSLTGDAPREVPEEAGVGWSPVWTLEYLPIQLVVSGSVGVLAIIAFAKLWKRRAGEGPGVTDETWRSVRFAAWISAPLLAFYLVVSFFTRVEGNWPIAAWFTACPLAGWAIATGVRERDRGLRVGGIVTGVIALAIPAVFVVLPWFHLKERFGVSLPAHRLMGFRSIADEAAEAMRRAENETGRPAFAMGVTYGRTALLSFYLPGQPTTYCAARYRTGRSGRQYDLWPHTDLENPETHAALAGRPGVLVQWPQAFWEQAFETVTPVGEVQRKPDRFYPVWIGTGYRGWDGPVEVGEE
ncbi:MAG: ArnT family glycosyltransferase [Phycisphaerales bacterium JB040]